MILTATLQGGSLPREKNLPNAELTPTAAWPKRPRERCDVRFARTQEIEKSTPRYLQLSATLRSVRYSSMPFFVEDPAMMSRSLANDLIACSALLLFQGTPSYWRKVNNRSRFLSKRCLVISGLALKPTPIEETEESINFSQMLP